MADLGWWAVRQPTWSMCRVKIWSLVGREKCDGARESVWAVRSWPAKAEHVHRLAEAQAFASRMRRQMWVVFAARASDIPEVIPMDEAARRLLTLNEKRTAAAPKGTAGDAIRKDRAWLAQEIRDLVSDL
ncbi:hypothetical protein [Micrococcus sp.]|uniref:hypothetical protein n=1 Tax=Micrococcus sp. TaxID=1271 RepID=UPI002A91891E|nr:hypothetical protein [Micrococcus sp.]MDY6054850.1 hypothetical protein [Micrococcus sp.]